MGDNSRFMLYEQQQRLQQEQLQYPNPTQHNIPSYQPPQQHSSQYQYATQQHPNEFQCQPQQAITNQHQQQSYSNQQFSNQNQGQPQDQQAVSQYIPPGNYAPTAIPVAERAGNTWDSIQVGKWEKSFCSCCSDCVPNGWMACCFPCITIAQISHRLRWSSYYVVLSLLVLVYIGSYVVDWIFAEAGFYRSSKYTLVDEQKSTGVNYQYNIEVSGGPALAHVTWYSVLTFTVCVMRHKLRKTFQIPGNICCDCCAAWCCTCCALTQMASHVKSYKPGMCDFGPPDTLPPYP